jgi:hypothetical protein
MLVACAHPPPKVSWQDSVPTIGPAQNDGEGALIVETEKDSRRSAG